MSLLSVGNMDILYLSTIPNISNGFCGYFPFIWRRTRLSPYFRYQGSPVQPFNDGLIHFFVFKYLLKYVTTFNFVSSITIKYGKFKQLYTGKSQSKTN